MSSRSGPTFDDVVGEPQDDAGRTLNTGAWTLDDTADDSLAVAPATLVPHSNRYDDLGLIARGGMGEVRRVRDRRLGRTLAMKVLQDKAVIPPGWRARFLAEARATAQLQHPGIVPVHDLGALPDGRLWFTMKEVVGRTLGEVIAEVHKASRHQWKESPSGWTLRRLVGVFRRVCEAVAHAHSRGVVHRDLKPDNLMVGAHGEVLVMDWGIAKVLGKAIFDDEHPNAEPSASTSPRLTRVGQITGTPRYMAPEQARGEHDRIDARTDVYALGSVLYELLSGRPPYAGRTSASVLALVRELPPDPIPRGEASPFHPDAPVRRRRGPPVPSELVDACERAMAREPEDRFESAEELAAEIGAWLEGARRADNALRMVKEAQTRRAEAVVCRAQAAQRSAQARHMREALSPWQPEADKLAAWAEEDAAAEQARQAERLELEEESLLRASLTHAPWLPQAHAALANIYRQAHVTNERVRGEVDRLRHLLQQHALALPADHPERTRHLNYLKGDGTLTLVSDPPGAEVLLHRYVPQNRRLVPVFERSMGTTPLRDVPLEMGSYLCVLRKAGHADVGYPVHIARQQHWHSVPPGADHDLPVRLPHLGELGEDDCYVPAGWFQVGGDAEASESLPGERVWCDALVFRRFPVRNRDYIAFLDDLAQRGQPALAESLAPRDRSGPTGAPVMVADSNHRFHLLPDADGDSWDLDWPVLLTDFDSARAFARWEAERTGRVWRLPTGLEWEKGARGVDGRFYPWGDAFDPSWAWMRHSQDGRPMPTVVGVAPVDASPYGIRDMAGNVRDWCFPSVPRKRRCPPPPEATPARPELRGGSWFNTAAQLRLATRHDFSAESRDFNLGFRLVRPL